MRVVQRIVPIAAILAVASTPGAQTPATHLLRGTVAVRTGAPIAGANVFLLEALDATLTDGEGRFALRTAAQDQVTIVVRHIGFAPATLTVPVDTVDALAFTL